jgi:hypothetical protein
VTIEDIIRQSMDDERKHKRLGFSLIPLYAFLSDTAHIARGQERQAILDALPREHDPEQNRSWNAGYDAALVAVMQILVERSMME